MCVLLINKFKKIHIEFGSDPVFSKKFKPGYEFTSDNVSGLRIRTHLWLCMVQRCAGSGVQESTPERVSVFQQEPEQDQEWIFLIGIGVGAGSGVIFSRVF